MMYDKTLSVQYDNLWYLVMMYDKTLSVHYDNLWY
jgi:hypothetical protein